MLLSWASFLRGGGGGTHTSNARGGGKRGSWVRVKRRLRPDDAVFSTPADSKIIPLRGDSNLFFLCVPTQKYINYRHQVYFHTYQHRNRSPMFRKRLEWFNTDWGEKKQGKKTTPDQLLFHSTPTQIFQSTWTQIFRRLKSFKIDAAPNFSTSLRSPQEHTHSPPDALPSLCV